MANLLLIFFFNCSFVKKASIDKQKKTWYLLRALITSHVARAAVPCL